MDLSEEALTDIRGDIWQSIQLALNDCQLRRRRICGSAMQREEDTIIESEKRNHEMKKMIKIKADEITKGEQDIEKLSARLVANENDLKQKAVQVGEAKTTRRSLSQVQTPYQL